MTSPILTWVVMQEQGNPDQNSEYRRMWLNKIIGIHFWCSRRGVSPLQPEHAWRVFGVVFWAWIKHGSKFRTPKLRNCRVCQISINFPVLRFFPRCLFTLGNFAGHVYQGVCWWSFGVQLGRWFFTETMGSQPGSSGDMGLLWSKKNGEIRSSSELHPPNPPSTHFADLFITEFIPLYIPVCKTYSVFLFPWFVGLKKLSQYIILIYGYPLVI